MHGGNQSGKRVGDLWGMRRGHAASTPSYYAEGCPCVIMSPGQTWKSMEKLLASTCRQSSMVKEMFRETEGTSLTAELRLVPVPLVREGVAQLKRSPCMPQSAPPAPTFYLHHNSICLSDWTLPAALQFSEFPRVKSDQLTNPVRLENIDKRCRRRATSVWSMECCNTKLTQT